MVEAKVGLARVAVKDEGRVRRAHPGRAEAEDVQPLAPGVGADDDIGQTVAGLRSEPVGHDRGRGGGVIDKTGRLLRPSAGHESLVAAAVVGKFVAARADDRVFVRALRVERHQLADVDAGDVCPDGPEIAAKFHRRLGFHVVGLQVRRTAGEPEEDHVRVSGRVGRGRGAEFQKICQPKPEQREPARLHESAPADRSAAKRSGVWRRSVGGDSRHCRRRIRAREAGIEGRNGGKRQHDRRSTGNGNPRFRGRF